MQIGNITAGTVKAIDLVLYYLGGVDGLLHITDMSYKDVIL